MEANNELQSNGNNDIHDHYQAHHYGDDPIVDIDHVDLSVINHQHPYGLLFDTFVPVSSLICACVVLRYTLLQSRHVQAQNLLNFVGLLCLSFWFISVVISVLSSSDDDSLLFTSRTEWHQSRDLVGMLAVVGIPITLIGSIVFVYYQSPSLQDALVWKHHIPVWILVLLHIYRIDALISIWGPDNRTKGDNPSTYVIPNLLAIQTLTLEGIIGLTAIPVSIILYYRRPNQTPQCLLRQRQFQAHYYDKQNKRRNTKRRQRPKSGDDDDELQDHQNSLFRKLQLFSSNRRRERADQRGLQKRGSRPQHLGSWITSMIPLSAHDLVWFWNSIGLYDIVSCYTLLILNYLQIGPESITTPHLSMIGYHPLPLLVLFQAPLAILIHLYLLLTPSTWFLLVQDLENGDSSQFGFGGGNTAGANSRDRDSLLPLTHNS